MYVLHGRLQEAPAARGNAYQGGNSQENLVVLRLEWSVTDEELRNYFAHFGQVAYCEVSVLCII